MHISVTSLTSVDAPNFTTTCFSRAGRSRASAIVLLSVALLDLAACAGLPRTSAQPLAFEVKTGTGLASVGIASSPPSMTDETFARLIRVGMERAAPGSVVATPMGTPFPVRRIVWDATPTEHPGVARLVVNFSDGSAPDAYAQEVVANGASTGTIIGVIESMTAHVTDIYTRERVAGIRPIGGMSGSATPGG